MHTKQQLHHFENPHHIDIHPDVQKFNQMTGVVNSEAIHSVAISTDGRFIVSGASNRSIVVFDMHTKHQLHHFQDAHTGNTSPTIHTHFNIDCPRSVVFSPDNKLIVSGSIDKSIRMFDIEAKREIHCFENAHTGNILLVVQSLRIIDSILSVAVSQDSRFIVSGSFDKSIKIFDMQTTQLLHHFQDAHTGNISPAVPSFTLTF